MNDLSLFAIPLDDLAVIEITGADAIGFMHGQITHDIANLPENAARLAGYCSPKGRLLGSLVVWRADNPQTPTLRALIKADIAQAIVKRLSMYVLRAKAKLSLSPLSVLGVHVVRNAQSSGGANIPESGKAPLANDMIQLPAKPSAWTVVHTDAGTWIAAPSADTAIDRWWHIGLDPAASTPGSASSAIASNPDQPEVSPATGPSDEASAWQVGDIVAGLPWIVAATQDVFIPQTLNLDLIDGVSFTKGCYPGQEIVARSHYRGTVKRRMAYGCVQAGLAPASAALPNQDIYDAHHPDNPCGRVINAAYDNRLHLLLEVQLSDLDSAAFRLGRADGPAITLQVLPYEIKVGA